MPKSKKPRRRYNPNRISRAVNLPRIDAVYMVFGPIYDVFDKLQSGEIECVKGEPVFRDYKDYQGAWCEIVPAILGWADCWDRLCAGEGIVFDSSPLVKLATKLKNGVPVTEEEVAAGRRTVDLNKKIFMSTPIDIIEHYTKTEMIQIQVDLLNLREAA
jgi:hypothetical protein